MTLRIGGKIIDFLRHSNFRATSLVFLFLTFGYGLCADLLQEEESNCKLKSRQPNWLAKVLSNYTNGKPAAVLFYAPDNESDKDMPVKYIVYYQSGSARGETDLAVLNDKVIPHGATVWYFPDGSIEKIGIYDRGVLEGHLQTFWQGGKLHESIPFQQGICHGDCLVYNEEGILAEKYTYFQGKLEGDKISYYPNGKQASIAHYKKGVIDGEATEWYENEAIKSKMFYSKGFLNGVSPSPAVQLFYENRSLKQKEDFAWGKSVGGAIYYDERGKELSKIADNESKKFKELLTEDKNGEKVVYHSNGKLKSKQTYQDGLLEGKSCLWHENGQLAYEGVFSKGLKEGKHCEWNEAGRLLSEISYKNDLENGNAREWNDQGVLISARHSLLGKLDGKCLSYYENGAPHQIQDWKEGVPVGQHVDYYPHHLSETPCLSRVLSYTDGELHGEQKSFYPNGFKQSLITYDFGTLHGPKTFWDPEGDSLLEAVYSHGLLEGRYYERSPLGKETICYYKTNRLHGLQQVYYPYHSVFGKIKSFEALFVNGKIEGEASEYNEAGNKVASTFYQNGRKEGIATLYTNDGKIFVTAEFKADCQNGPACEYFPDGSVRKKVFFVNDLQEGEEITFHENGKVASIIPYSHGKIHGFWREWNDLGTLLFEAEYRQGKRNGKVVKFNEDGSMRVAKNYVDDLLKSE